MGRCSPPCWLSGPRRLRERHCGANRQSSYRCSNKNRQLLLFLLFPSFLLFTLQPATLISLGCLQHALFFCLNLVGAFDSYKEPPTGTLSKTPSFTQSQAFVCTSPPACHRQALGSVQTTLSSSHPSARCPGQASPLHRSDGEAKAREPSLSSSPALSFFTPLKPPSVRCHPLSSCIWSPRGPVPHLCAS